MKGGKTGGDEPQEPMDSGKQTESFRGEGVGGWVSLVMDIKEGMDCMEYWVLYPNIESWNTTSKTNDVLYGDECNIIKKIFF